MTNKTWRTKVSYRQISTPLEKYMFYEKRKTVEDHLKAFEDRNERQHRNLILAAIAITGISVMTYIPSLTNLLTGENSATEISSLQTTLYVISVIATFFAMSAIASINLLGLASFVHYSRARLKFWYWFMVRTWHHRSSNKEKYSEQIRDKKEKSETKMYTYESLRPLRSSAKKRATFDYSDIWVQRYYYHKRSGKEYIKDFNCANNQPQSQLMRDEVNTVRADALLRLANKCTNTIGFIYLCVAMHLSAAIIFVLQLF